MRSDGKLAAFFENLVMAAIMLVLVQTFLEDFSTAADWSWTTRRALVVSGFIFDLFFTVEFLVRVYRALAIGGLGRYLSREWGWIDFLASVPLVLFSSGPALMALFIDGVSIAGYGGALSLLKLIKAIRIARVLRLLRALKLFRQVRFAGSPMAQRHLAKISGLAVSAVVFSTMVFSLASTALGARSLNQEFHDHSVRRAAYLAGLAASARPEAAVKEFAEADGRILIVKKDGRGLYSRHADEYYAEAFGPADYLHLNQAGLEVFYDLRPVNQQLALENLANFAIVAAALLLFLLYYGGHFALSVSDPLNVMIRGLREHDYNLEARIDERYAGDEVFALAGEYNRIFLPLKNRSAGDGGADSALKLSDVQDLFKTGA